MPCVSATLDPTGGSRRGPSLKGGSRRGPRAVPRVCAAAGLRGVQGRTMSPTHGLTAIRSWRSRSLLCRECPRHRCLFPIVLCHSCRTQGPATARSLGPAPTDGPSRPGCLSFFFCVRKKSIWGSWPFPVLEGQGAQTEGAGCPDQGAGAAGAVGQPYQGPAPVGCIGPQHLQHGLQGHPEQTTPALTRRRRELDTCGPGSRPAGAQIHGGVVGRPEVRRPQAGP